jgi:hypothetical protein
LVCEDRLFEILRALADEAPGVHVDRGERLGLIDDQVAARGQRHLARQRAADLVLDAVGVEDRLVPLVELDVVDALGHEHLHEPHAGARTRRGVDDDLLDVVGEQIARGLEHEIELGVEARRGALRPRASSRSRPRGARGSRRRP